MDQNRMECLIRAAGLAPNPPRQPKILQNPPVAAPTGRCGCLHAQVGAATGGFCKSLWVQPEEICVYAYMHEYGTKTS